MSRLFESFEVLNRGCDVRLLGQVSLRSVLVWLLVGTFIFGVGAGITLDQVVHLQRFHWERVLPFAALGFMTARYALRIYSRLD
jgi:hypothetical protein